MKRNRLELQPDSDDEENILSDDEYEELKKDLAAYTGRRNGGRSERVLQNNIPAMLAKIEELQLVDSEGKPMEWVETLIVDTDAPLKVPDINDDLSRETIIYNEALKTVHKAIAMCEAKGIKHQRPEDYYAEMLKTDDHMLKLKDHLLAEKRRKDERNKMIQDRQMKKYAKKVQVETHLRRQKQKTEDLAVVKEWRKKQKRGGSGADTEFPEELLDPKNPMRKALLAKSPVAAPSLQKSKKRKAKDERYGNGGAKRFKKANDGASAADMSGFSRKGNALGTGPKKPTSGMRNGFPTNPQKSSGGGFGQRPKKVATRRPGKDARRRG